MAGRGGHIAVALLALGPGLAGCAQPADPDAPPPVPEYLGTQAELLDDELLQVFVTLQGDHLKGIGARAAAAAYADCAVAGQSARHDFAFARHIRTNVTEESGVWRADAIYTISRTLPRGIKTIDVRETAAACDAAGIPTV